MESAITQTAPATQYAVGIVSVQTRGRSKGYSYHAAKLYVRTRKARGTGYYWKASTVRGPSRRGVYIIQKDAEEIATRYNCPVLDIRHGSNAE